MCGIAGYCGIKEIPSFSVEKTLGLMKLRGPDQQLSQKWKLNSGKSLYFLHSRLAIIDLDSRSNQPMKIGNKWIIFNGELYNYLEIRKFLKDEGYIFETNSDTEVLLQLINAHGWDSLKKCEGMWAYAVFDEEKEVVSLCRDRFGEKPLYVYYESDGFYFGSEIKYIFALLGNNLPLNHSHIYRYLINGYKSLKKTNETFFKSVFEFPIASYKHFYQDGTEIKKKYWGLEYRPENNLTYQDAVKGVREKIITSMSLRLRSDVPLAFCMSGGVDSVSLISIAKKIFNYDVHGFTILNTDERYDERNMVDLAVRDLNIRHTNVFITQENFLQNLRNLIIQHDGPVSTISYYVHWLLMQQISLQGYRVSISGTGADELLTGYYDHHLLFFSSIKTHTSLLSQSIKNWEENVYEYIQNCYLKDPYLFINTPEFRQHIYSDSEYYKNYLKNIWNEDFSEVNYADDILRNRMMNELFHESVPVILHEDDLNAMSCSIENRSPFLDRVLCEFCYTIPTYYLIQNGMAKKILRDAMRGITPNAILDEKRKVGFNAPIFSLLNLKDETVYQFLFEPGPIYNIINIQLIKDLCSKKTLSNNESKFLFNFINVKFFLEIFN